VKPRSGTWEPRPPGSGLTSPWWGSARAPSTRACPVIVLIHAPDPDFIKEASKRGIFAYITDADAKDWQSSIDIVLRRFAEYHDLEGAFGRRDVTKGGVDRPTRLISASAGPLRPV
jgi:hypothetical protein